MKLLLFSIFALASVWAAPPKTPVAHIYGAIEILKNENLTCNFDSDCRALAFGHKPCGGPSGYIIVSTINRHFAEMQELAVLSEVLGERYSRDNNLSSNCRLLLVPPVACSENKCVDPRIVIN